MKFTEKKVYSQNGEDGVIKSIFDEIGTITKIFVEIGCEDGTECNTRALSDEQGWDGVRLDKNYQNEERKIFKRTVDVENCNEILHQLDIPLEFDLLSLDIDFNDFHILRTILGEFAPRVIVVEYNSSLGPDADLVVPYMPDHIWDRTNYFGASYTAFERLAEVFGYRVVYGESQGVNLFLVRSEVIGGRELSAGSHFRPPGYGGGAGHPADRSGRKYLSSKHYLLPGVKTAVTPFGRISFFQNDVYIGAVFAGGRYWDEAALVEISRQLADGIAGQVLDIGAHVGSHSIALAALNPSLRFCCFEPQFPLFLLAERNIHENNLSHRIEAYNAAAGHAAATFTLSQTIIAEESNLEQPVEYGTSIAVNLGGMQFGHGGQECRVLRIDDMAFSSVVYVKIDVEGAEPLAFHGMQRLLANNLPFVYFEDRDDRRLSLETLDTLGVPPEVREFSPARYLASLGYRIERLGLDYLAIPSATPRGLRIPRATETDRIPACIFQTWKSKTEFPPNFAHWLSTFDAFNPGFEHIIWDDFDNRHFISSTFPWFLPIYDAYPKEIYRADAVRYFFLYMFGGIYSDMDTECLKPLDYLLDRADVLLGRMGSDPHHPHSIPNATMASRPRQEFWLFVIWMLMDAAKRSAGPEASTGPIVLKSAADLYLARDPLWVRSAIQTIVDLLPPQLRPRRNPCKIEILPPREWYAIDWTDPIHQRLRREILGKGPLDAKTARTLFPNSSVISYWAHTW